MFAGSSGADGYCSNYWPRSTVKYVPIANPEKIGLKRASISQFRTVLRVRVTSSRDHSQTLRIILFSRTRKPLGRESERERVDKRQKGIGSRLRGGTSFGESR